MEKTKTRQRVRKGVLLLYFILFPVVLNYLSPYLSISAASEGIASGSLLFFGLLLLSSLILGRAFCAWICPGGAAQEICLLVNDRRVRRNRYDWIKYVIWTPWPTLRLKASTDKCVSCGTCTKNYPMSLEVQNMVEKSNMESAECILCGQCVDNCPHSVIRYTFSRGV